MNKQFVTYEIALKLKELGFNEKCLASYYTDDERNYGKGDIYDCRRKLSSSIDFDPFKEEFDNFYINSNETYYVSAPLWQQVIDWLREKYNLCIEIQCPQREFDFYSWTIHEPLGINDEEYNCQTYEDGFTNNYYKAREQAILKVLELCKK